jgi:hypothetical protein
MGSDRSLACLSQSVGELSSRSAVQSSVVGSAHGLAHFLNYFSHAVETTAVQSEVIRSLEGTACLRVLDGCEK